MEKVEGIVYDPDIDTKIITGKGVSMKEQQVITEKDKNSIIANQHSQTSAASIEIEKISKNKSIVTINGNKIEFNKKLNITENIKKIADNQTVLRTLYGVALLTAASVYIIGSKLATPINEVQKVANESQIDYNDFCRLIPIKCYHKMQAGDTIWDIATNHGILPKDIKGITNDIDINGIIREGEEITYCYNIREDQIKYATTLVDYDNSLEAIAEQYNTDTETLKRLNENHYDIDTILVPNFKGIKEITQEYEQDIENQRGKSR